MLSAFVYVYVCVDMCVCVFLCVYTCAVCTRSHSTRFFFNHFWPRVRTYAILQHNNQRIYNENENEDGKFTHLWQGHHLFHEKIDHVYVIYRSSLAVTMYFHRTKCIPILDDRVIEYSHTNSNIIILRSFFFLSATR